MFREDIEKKIYFLFLLEQKIFGERKCLLKILKKEELKSLSMNLLS